ncbi:hypothetical protein OG824_31705 [Streptomyces prunicolor]|uniref:hypothetical protein n=1 Tax=Streptomyces prunicolor TaxID=67348 RepID=UPI002253ADDA|nr:hypothetical protein [Streptomyces prunicolor]MCX5239776.1 hypothetical protein [Streptomyces prunicolor]
MPETTDPLRLIEPPPPAVPDEQLLAKVRAALGFAHGWTPIPELGESLTRVLIWSQLELNDLYERLGGAVAVRPVQRPLSDGVVAAEEVTLTVVVEGVGPVEVFTDWCEDLAKYGPRDQLPLMCAAA